MNKTRPIITAALLAAISMPAYASSLEDNNPAVEQAAVAVAVAQDVNVVVQVANAAIPTPAVVVPDLFDAYLNEHHHVEIVQTSYAPEYYMEQAARFSKNKIDHIASAQDVISRLTKQVNGLLETLSEPVVGAANEELTAMESVSLPFGPQPGDETIIPLEFFNAPMFQPAITSYINLVKPMLMFADLYNGLGGGVLGLQAAQMILNPFVMGAPMEELKGFYTVTAENPMPSYELKASVASLLEGSLVQTLQVYAHNSQMTDIVNSTLAAVRMSKENRTLVDIRLAAQDLMKITYFRDFGLDHGRFTDFQMPCPNDNQIYIHILNELIEGPIATTYASMAGMPMNHNGVILKNNVVRKATGQMVRTLEEKSADFDLCRQLLKYGKDNFGIEEIDSPYLHSEFEDNLPAFKIDAQAAIFKVRNLDKVFK